MFQNEKGSLKRIENLQLKNKQQGGRPLSVHPNSQELKHNTANV